MGTHKLVLLATCLLLSFPVAANAATLTVTTNADVSASECTLRDAIAAANGNSVKGACPAGEASGTDVIKFALPAPSTITVATALPTILQNLTIEGPGSSALTVSGGNTTNVFRSQVGTDTISGLTVANAACLSGCGLVNAGSTLLLEGVVVEHNVAAVTGGANAFPGPAGILNSSGSLTIRSSAVRNNETLASNATSQNAPAGGGLLNNGGAVLTIEDSTIAGNLVSAIAAGVGTTNSVGGGLSNAGELVIKRSTLSGNVANAGGSNTFNSSQGGAISNSNSAEVKVTIVDSTIAGNSATASGPGSVESRSGGFVVFGSSFTVQSSTIAGNSAGSGANISGGTATFSNTIVANPLGGGKNCNGAVLSGGFNLESSNTCGFGMGTDQPSTDPLLDPAGLADNGGPTQTVALLHGSPAIDRGLAALGESADQRGRPRPFEIPEVPNAAGGDGADVGAYEVQLPDTQIVEGPAEGTTVGDSTQTFSFKSDESRTSFECALDAAAFASCPNPATFSGLADGSHTLQVRAVGVAGYPDPTPALRTFLVKGPPPPAPQTRLGRIPAKTSKHRLKIRFSSSQPGSTFRCKLDRGKWRACTSPFRTKFLALGKHRFSVRATNAQGTADPTPATRAFRVVPRP